MGFDDTAHGHAGLDHFADAALGFGDLELLLPAIWRQMLRAFGEERGGFLGAVEIGKGETAEQHVFRVIRDGGVQVGHAIQGGECALGASRFAIDICDCQLDFGIVPANEQSSVVALARVVPIGFRAMGIAEQGPGLGVISVGRKYVQGDVLCIGTIAEF